MQRVAIAIIGILILAGVTILSLNSQGATGLTAFIASKENTEGTQHEEGESQSQEEDRPAAVEQMALSSRDAPESPGAASSPGQPVETEPTMAAVANAEPTVTTVPSVEAITPNDSVVPAAAQTVTVEPTIIKPTVVQPTTPAISTPGPGAMTVYSVQNPNSGDIVIRHIITDTNSFYYEFTSTVPANSTAEYHLRDMPDVPSPFTGAMSLASDKPFTAELVGYDY